MSPRVRWSNKGRRIDDHIGPVIKAIIILNNIPLLLVEARVCMAVPCGSSGMVTKYGRDLRMSWVSCRRRVTKMSECIISVQITTQIGHALPRENTEYISLVFGELCNRISVSDLYGRYSLRCYGSPAGASRQNCSRSVLKKAWTPVRLRWVNRGQELRSLMILCVLC